MRRPAAGFKPFGRCGGLGVETCQDKGKAIPRRMQRRSFPDMYTAVRRQFFDGA